MNKEKKPLYRKVNTHVHDPYLWKGGECRWERHSYKNDFETTKTPMSSRGYKGGVGYDYKPLYRYLMKQIGRDWNEIHSEILPRLPAGKEGADAVWYWVRHPNKPGDYGTFFIDENNLLQKEECYKTLNKLWDYHTSMWEYHYSNEPFDVCFPTLADYMNRFQDVKEVVNRYFSVSYGSGKYSPDKVYIDRLLKLSDVLLKYGKIRHYELYSDIEIVITDKAFIKEQNEKKRKSEKLERKREKKRNRYPKHRKDEEVVVEECDD